MDKIQILEFGIEDWNRIYHFPDQVKLTFAEQVVVMEEENYDLVFWDREPQEAELDFFRHVVKPYTLYITDDVFLGEAAQELFEQKYGKRIRLDELQDFFDREVKFYFPRPYGEKFKPNNIEISRNFKGSVKWNGQYSVALKGKFGEEFTQIAFWRNDIPIEAGQVLDFWLEYKKTSGIEISMVITQIAPGTSIITARRTYFESELEQIVQFQGGDSKSQIFVSLNARGTGELQIIALHDRYSRGSHGYFLPGGERYVTSEREEIFCYFDPMDWKPPLNVYFSGYKTQEGFEGYNMMRRLGAPFLLIAEQRLKGGSFYMGTQEYETLMADTIRHYLNVLGFTADQLILSGISMGTSGAAYYGCDLKPHALILGKPLVSLGNVAANERLLRPGGFPTSLDVLHYVEKGMDQDAIERMNRRFWDKFGRVDWDNTKWIVSYMMEDDYDLTGYQDLLSHINAEGTEIYGKGLHGRHNDNTGGIVNWFIGQYKSILAADFGRKRED